MLKTKKQQVIEFIEAGDYASAMKIAKGFHIELTKEENLTVTRAYEMIKNRRFYEQLGFDFENEWDKAVDILYNIYIRK